MRSATESKIGYSRTGIVNKAVAMAEPRRRDLTMTPNTSTPLPRAGINYDIDDESWQEENNSIKGSPTFASITSRSHEIRLVHNAFRDEAVTSIANSIDRTLWQARGGRRTNREVVQGEP